MRRRDHIALTLSPLILRIALALTFAYAGASKLVGTTHVAGDDAARLANLQVPFLSPDHEPGNLLPQSPLPEPNPDTQPPQQPDQQTDQPTDQDATPPSAQEDQPDTDDAPTSDQPEPDQPQPDTPETEPTQTNPVATTPAPTITRVAQSATPSVASDFPQPREVLRVYTIALLLDKCANPPLTADSQTQPPILPSFVSSGRLPVYAAWAAALTEILASILLLLGAFTRLSALSLVAVMGVAMWTTHLGPAAFHTNDAILGFIPSAADPWNPASYANLLWQLALACAALAVFLTGAGPLSADRFFFPPRAKDPYQNAEPEPRKKKTDKDEPPARTAFDRAPDPNP